MLIFTLMLLWLPQNEPFYESYAKGQEAFREKRHEDVVRYMEAAVLVKPESTKSAKTYGVQLITYYPYSYLAQSFVVLGDLDKARDALEKAYRYREDQDDRVALALDLTGQLIATRSSPTKSVTDSSTDYNSEAIIELIRQNELAQAKIQVRLLINKYPEDKTLNGFLKLIEDLLINKDREKQLNRGRIESLVRQAKQNEEVDNSLEALSQFQAIKVLEPNHPEAGPAIARLRAKVEAQGRTEQEIEEAAAIALNKIQQTLDDTTKELQIVGDENARLYERLDQLEQESAISKAKITVNWEFVPVPDNPQSADITAAIISNVGLRQAKLVANRRTVHTWEINGARAFNITPLKNFRFTQQVAVLYLEVIDENEHIHHDSYEYIFQTPAKPPTPINTKIPVLLLAAVILFFYFLRERKSRTLFRNRFNPYIAGAPVHNENMFFGRKQLLKQILNTLHNNSLMIFGERRIGKTSFLHQLNVILPAMDDPHFVFIPIFVDLQGVREPQFFTTLDHEINQAMADRGVGLEVTEGDVDARLFTHRLRQFINSLKSTCEKVPKLVLLLDEVDVMNEFSEKTNQQLRSVFMKGFAKHLVAVMAGIHINTSWKSQSSPWYNFFEQIELKPFTEQQALELIVNPVKGIYQFNKEATDQIVEITQGKPYLIQKICVNLIAHVLNENRRHITKQDVDYVFKEIKSEVWAAE